MGERELTYGDAVKEAIAEEMRHSEIYLELARAYGAEVTLPLRAVPMSFRWEIDQRESVKPTSGKSDLTHTTRKVSPTLTRGPRHGPPVVFVPLRAPRPVGLGVRRLAGRARMRGGRVEGTAEIVARARERTRRLGIGST